MPRFCLFIGLLARTIDNDSDSDADVAVWGLSKDNEDFGLLSTSTDKLA